MKKILITGQKSYIGSNLKQWLENYPESYTVDSISIRDESWRKRDFSEYDVVFHVAAIVHKKEKSDMESMYFKVNVDLPVEIAEKAKRAGVKQFIFMSTMAVYGEEGDLGKERVITSLTKPKPKTFYGKSKLEAETRLQKIKNGNFKIVIIRPPMIYGPNCPGNYAKLEMLAMKAPLFPMIKNSRSVLSINNLCQYVKTYIDNDLEGVFLPQDNAYINTSLLVKKIAENNGKKVYLSKILGLVISIFGKKIGLIKKVFGNLVYER